MKGVVSITVLSLSTVFYIASAQINLGATSLRKIPHCASGRTGQVIVHLFSWRWKDIAVECENVLGPKGYCGVQVSPPNEHRIVTSPNRPWWERYQPVSYKLESRSGSRAEFIDMVNRCNAVGVRIYIDAVINHMVAADAGLGTGSGGSFYDSNYKKFDGVPYGPADFTVNCSTVSGNIEDSADKKQVRDCSSLTLLDLNTGSTYVRDKIVQYFNDMLAIGIDGYRIDAAKHIWQQDLEAILSSTCNTNSGDTPFVYQEVINLSLNDTIKAKGYTSIGRVTEFKYGAKLTEVCMTGKIPLSNLLSCGSAWGMLPSEDSLVFIDNFNSQRSHGGRGKVFTYKQTRDYRMANVFMLSWPYGVPRVMSSYEFTNDSAGPPAASPAATGDCKNGWVCEHRWRQISNMVEWRNSAGSGDVDNWWSNGNNQIAFSRGKTAFIAFNRNNGFMEQLLKTGLPAGEYCDIISGESINNECTGKKVVVGADSYAAIRIPYGTAENPIVAIHIVLRLDINIRRQSILSHVSPSKVIWQVKLKAGMGHFWDSSGEGAATGWALSNISGIATGSKLSKKATASNPPPTTLLPTSPPANIKRTIIFLKKVTKYGEYIFLRGGHGAGKTIPITYPAPKKDANFRAYNSWSKGDTVLDWTGAEKVQGTLNGAQAKGSPMIWTDSDSNSPNYVSENTYGPHYWMWDVMMDCSNLSGGYFEVKGYSSAFGYERNIVQKPCLNQPSPSGISTINHLVKCGYKNMIIWNENFCTMERL